MSYYFSRLSQFAAVEVKCVKVTKEHTFTTKWLCCLHIRNMSPYVEGRESSRSMS